MRIDHPEAALLVGRLVKGDRRVVPASPRLHVYVVAGAVSLRTGGPAATLGAGDSALVCDEHDVTLTCTADRAETLVWLLPPP